MSPVRYTGHLGMVTVTDGVRTTVLTLSLAERALEAFRSIASEDGVFAHWTAQLAQAIGEAKA